jgi:dTDP-4-dehydrorhamnose 3,5-epimerase
MIFSKTPLKDSYLIEITPHKDQRGMFARVFCSKEFSDADLESKFVQANISENFGKGTVRGMHYQTGAHAEVKVVRCFRGEIYDVIVDLRPNSPNYLQHFGIILSESNNLALYIPKGFAHGYQTLTDNTAIHYLISEFHDPNSEAGCRYNDPLINIHWPLEISSMSEKDQKWPLLNP